LWLSVQAELREWTWSPDSEGSRNFGTWGFPGKRLGIPRLEPKEGLNFPLGSGTSGIPGPLGELPAWVTGERHPKRATRPGSTKGTHYQNWATHTGVLDSKRKGDF